MIGPGTQVGPYQVIEQIGRGGMATVFKAQQPALERLVAIKVLPDLLASDPEFRERFHREAVAIARLQHPNILTVFDHGEHEGQLYIVTEYVEGGTLADVLNQSVPAERVRQLLEPIASALDYAHSEGVIHRDVKPSNILMRRGTTPVLSDFGLARMMASGDRLTRIDMVVGTPEYMSPEQCAGQDVGPAADQYSLAVVAYEALTGKVPYQAETPAAVILAHLKGPLPMPRQANPDMPEELERVLLKGLAQEPESRFHSCSEFVAALTSPPPLAPTVAQPAPVLAATAVTAAPTLAAASSPPPPPAAPRRRWGLLLAVGIALALVIGGTVGAVSLVGRAGRPGTAGRHHASPSPPAPSPSPSPAPTVARGAPIWTATLTSADVNVQQDPAGSGTVTFDNGIAINVTNGSGDVDTFFQVAPLTKYVAEMRLQATNGSLVDCAWFVQNPGTGGKDDVYVDIDASAGQVSMLATSGNNTDHNLTPATAVPGFQSGTPFTLDVAVAPSPTGVGYSFRLYLNGTQVGSVDDSLSLGPVKPDLDCNGGIGGLKILALSYNQLPN